MSHAEWEGDRRLIAGLGNPGRQYRNSRHNVGFLVVDQLAAENGGSPRRVRARSLIRETRLEGRRAILVKPQTYMNLSGEAVAALLRYYRLPAAALLVVCDDLDLPLGVIRLKPEGGSAGHRGLVSILRALGTEKFARLRIGIGRPPGGRDPSDYVLDGFSRAEQSWVDEVVERAGHCVRLALREGLAPAMTMFNAPPTLPR